MLRSGIKHRHWLLKNTLVVGGGETQALAVKRHTRGGGGADNYANTEAQAWCLVCRRNTGT